MSADAAAVLGAAKAKGVMIATAESCTGGLIAAALTEVAGSSAVVERGFVTYSNEAKTEMLGVTADLIADRGAVSEEVVTAMVAGALAKSRATLAVAVTGIAGPGGGSEAKPVGLVFVAAGLAGGEMAVQKCRFDEEGITDRSGIRKRTVEVALAMLLDQLTAAPSP
ncbi:CinA family protein [Ahrensia sp. R2A130]|uniref:CinA family protein n=1 Tax=Ahrensia sp. R2A130 TaxID=744979 RepID=UPI0001E0B458|nr:CinA family protein [Ahrensia sp. R2A130]EFL90133.1 protein YgaD [Ahrensia sp. R2A130]